MAWPGQWWDREVSACSGPQGHDWAPPARAGIKIRCPWSDTTHTVSKAGLTKFLAEDHWNCDADGRPEIPFFLLRGDTGARDPWSATGQWKCLHETRDDQGNYWAQVQWENPGKARSQGKGKGKGKGHQHRTRSRSRSRDERRREINAGARASMFNRQEPAGPSARRERRERHEAENDEDEGEQRHQPLGALRDGLPYRLPPQDDWSAPAAYAAPPCTTLD